MKFQAILSNPSHPEYGVATIPLPLSREEYDHFMEMLSALGIGDAVRQDCKVEEIIHCYPVLKQLEGQSVNVDELDYLVKRLDSFCVAEDAQFQAMAAKLALTDIKDFINLTFCCQQATVITDFSDLEEVGRGHYLNVNGGCATTKELDDLDGERVARILIDSGAGVVTPYGVVYDNGMKLEPLYSGGAFPPYLYDAHSTILEAYPLSAPDDRNKAISLCLPMTALQIERTLARSGIDSVAQVKFKHDSTFWDGENDLTIFEHESLKDLNEMYMTIADLDKNGLSKLDAVISFAKPKSALQVKHLAEILELFDFIPKVKTSAEYGRYMIEESGHFEYDPNLEDFYDFAGYARQRMRQEQGQFVEGGYVSYHGLQSLDEVMTGSPALDEGFQIGGMQ